MRCYKNVLKQAVFNDKIDSRGHNPDKLNALKNILKWLQPNLIIVTGDITNFGDTESFKLASSTLEEIKTVSKAKHILCVPGNHDSLAERANHLMSKLRTKIILKFFAKFIREVDLSIKLSSTGIGDASACSLLQNYDNIIGSKYGKPDAGFPFIDSAGWGDIFIFLFDSTNDLGFMANEGRIGPQQFNALNNYIQDPEIKKKLSRAVRIALLHHHPISAPGADLSAAERAYNSMKDGPLFVDYMNWRGFDFIFHGHEHKPYLCNLNYQYGEGTGICIVAAGSALEGEGTKDSSFNVIDLWTPFEARLRRYKYKVTGFDERPEIDRRQPIRPLSEICLSDAAGSQNREDYTLRNFFHMENEVYDETNEYSLLEYEAKIEKNQRYIGKYRRVGRVIGPGKDDGPIFVITGSPAMHFKDMKVSAINNKSGSELSCRIVKEFPEKKIIRVLHEHELSPNAEFDITLNFLWNVIESEPNDYDGLNLLYFRYPVTCLSYKAVLPWKPAQVKVKAIGIDEQPIEIKSL